MHAPSPQASLPIHPRNLALWLQCIPWPMAAWEVLTRDHRWQLLIMGHIHRLARCILLYVYVVGKEAVALVLSSVLLDEPTSPPHLC